jgi:hypothetical protein
MQGPLNDESMALSIKRSCDLDLNVSPPRLPQRPSLRRSSTACPLQATRLLSTAHMSKTVSQDTLSRVLRSIHLRRAVCFNGEGATPWVTKVPPASDMAAAVMP